MTDDQPEGTFEPDGWGVYHLWTEPVEDVKGYMFGPFPTYEIAEFMQKGSGCRCETTLVPLMFPPGIKLLAALDADNLPASVRQMLGIPAEGAAPAAGSPHLPDRVH